MSEWRVTVRATVTRTYFVEADNEKDAIAKSVDALPDHEEDEDVEIMSAFPPDPKKPGATG